MSKTVKLRDKGIVRRVNALERVFYMVPGYKVIVNARLTGHIDDDKFQQAVAKVQGIHPLLRSKIVFDDDGEAYFSTENVGAPDIQIMKMKSDMHWYDAYVKEFAVPFDPENRPMVTFLLLKGDEYSDLIVLASHVVTDGMSAVFIIRDLLEAYANPSEKKDELFPVDIVDFLPARVVNSFKNKVSGLFTGYFNKKWNKNPILFNNDDYLSINDWFWKKNDYQAIFLEIAKDDSAELISWCHEEKVSIGNAVIAAFVAARYQIKGPFEGYSRHVSIPFDLRRHSVTPLGDIVSMCSGAVEILLDYNSELSFMENARIFQSKLVKKAAKLDTDFLDLLKVDPNLLDAMATFAFPALKYPDEVGNTDNIRKLISDKKNIAFKMVAKYIDRVAGTLSSNLGRLNIAQDYGELHLDRMMLLPLLKSNVDLYINAATIDDKMVFSLSFVTPEGVTPEEKMTEMTEIRSLAVKLLKIDKPASGKRYC